MNSREYMEWIMQEPHDSFSVFRPEEDRIILDSVYAYGEISLYHLETDVFEMQLTRRSDEENIFFLHFELKEEEHAKRLYREMTQCLVRQKEKSTLKILLSCTSGLTTNFFAEKMRAAAETLSLDYEIRAVAFNQLYKTGFDYNVILLAPQIAYELKKAQAMFTRQTVMAIPAQIFASYDAGKMIDLIRAELAKQAVTVEQKAVAKVMRDIENNANIFVVTVTHDVDETRLCHRLYEKGTVVLSQTFVKSTNSLQDIRDILDTQLRALRKNYRIDIVSISIPGILQTEQRLSRIDYGKISQEFTETYGLPVFFCHNTSAVAYGYYARQDRYDIVAYHSQPRGALIGGQGYVYEGVPLSGRNMMGGEVEYIGRKLMPWLDENKRDKTYEEIRDSVISYLVSGIAVIAPEVFLIRSDLTPDIEEIRKELLKYIPAENMPELIHVRDITEFAYLGTMLYGLHELRRTAQKKIREKRENRS